MISAVIDACVLYPGTLRGLLLNLATDEAYFPLWSEKVRDEWISSLLQNRTDLTLESMERTRRIMDIHFPNSLVRGFESHIKTLELPDPKDRHVLAVAIHAKAEYIITDNVRDFPSAILQSHNTKAVLPDDFVWQLTQSVSPIVFTSVKRHRLSLKNPPKTVLEYLSTLENLRLQKTVAFLREHKDKI